MVFPLDWAFLGLKDPTALAQMMAQQNISPDALVADLNVGNQIGQMAQQQQAQQVAMRPDQPQVQPMTQFPGMDNNVIPPQGLPNAQQEQATVQNVGVGANTDQGLLDEFMAPIRERITNPNALAAIQATGMHESGFSPGNVFGTWSDPSQSGQAGTSGGALSWRAERLQNLIEFGGSGGKLPSADTQGKFFLEENPDLIAQLQGAQSPEEAQTLMNNAWKFAGYDQQGGEAASRINTAQQLARGGSTIDFGRAGGTSQATPPASSTSAVDSTITAGSGAPTGKAEKAKTLADKLAALGKGIKVPEARPTPDAPRIGGVPEMGGAAFQPAGMEQLFALLGGNLGGATGGIPALSQLIQGARG